MGKSFFSLLILLCVLPVLQAEEPEVMAIEIAPFTMVKNGSLRGFSIDIMKEIDRRLQQNHEIRLYPMGRALNYLESKNSALLSLIRNKSREDKYKWVGPIGTIQIVFCIRTDSDIVINSLEEAKNYRIGYVNKTSGEKILEKYNFPDIEPTTGNLNTLKLVRKRVDVIISRYYETVAGIHAPYMKVAYAFPSEEVFIAFNRDTPDSVIRLWQNKLDEMKADGTYEKIRLKYYTYSK